MPFMISLKSVKSLFICTLIQILNVTCFGCFGQQPLQNSFTILKSSFDPASSIVDKRGDILMQYILFKSHKFKSTTVLSLGKKSILDGESEFGAKIGVM